MKLSLILPYWDRQKAADKALQSILWQYSGDLCNTLEVIVVDDGNPVPFVVRDFQVFGNKVDIRVIRLPLKDGPKSPVTCWNEGARQATGDVLILSCIEVLHDKPILAQLAATLKGPDDYALAAAWCPEEGAWHTHSSVQVPDCPPGTGIGFCAALTPDLYWKAGGFEEGYREGAGYEDRDWILRLCSVGANFIIRDDLVVIHPKTGASIAWGDEKFAHNLALYRLKWPQTPALTFVCLNAGNYCGHGTEYVNNLADMVKRNMPGMVRWQFVCLTDDPAGLDDIIQVLPLPEDLKGWWGKLYLFKRGLFPDGARMIFLDLDTLVLGPLAPLLKYSGDMAILRDFYVPQRGAPGVILWRSGFGYEIWEEWEAAERPWNALGDLGWIESMQQGRFTRTLDRLQDVMPGVFCSYKAHCNPYPPQGVSVVCFHGLPRPHECGSAWVADIWKVGGNRMPEVVRELNTADSVLAANVKASCARDLPWLDLKPAHDGVAVIVGGGPSLAETVDAIEAQWAQGATIVALNGAAHYLVSVGIPVDAQVILDARKENAAFVSPASEYFFASTCAPEVFDVGVRPTLYHPHTSAIVDWVPANGKPLHLIGGGSTVGMIALSLFYTQGFRKFHLFGYDSSYSEGQHHAYEQKLNDGENVVDVVCEGRSYRCAAWMVTQVQEFQETSINLAQLDCEIQVHGSGLLPYVAWQMTLNDSIQEAA